MRVICTNDKNLPEGAAIEAGQNYIVDFPFLNNFGQKAFMLKGIVNEGITPRGLGWCGYDATRFAVLDKDPVVLEETEAVEEELSILN